jgi:hypothetical protein
METASRSTDPCCYPETVHVHIVIVVVHSMIVSVHLTLLHQQLSCTLIRLAALFTVAPTRLDDHQTPPASYLTTGTAP